MSRRPLIEFSVAETLDGIVPEVAPATRHIPDEYSRTPMRFDTTESISRSTLRACSPYFDAMTAGFVLPLPVDVRIIAEGPSVRYLFAGYKYGADGRESNEPTWVHHHPSAQGFPAIEGKAILKAISPYYIRTRRGWGSLFLPLLNRQTPLRAVAGLVNTSKYRSRVNIVFTWEGGDGDFEFSQGTPLAQVVPVPLGEQRYAYGSISMSEAAERDRDGEACPVTRHVYKTRFREKVTWKKE